MLKSSQDRRSRIALGFAAFSYYLMMVIVGIIDLCVFIFSSGISAILRVFDYYAKYFEIFSNLNDNQFFVLLFTIILGYAFLFAVINGFGNRLKFFTN